VKTQLYFAP